MEGAVRKYVLKRCVQRILDHGGIADAGKKQSSDDSLERALNSRSSHWPKASRCVRFDKRECFGIYFHTTLHSWVFSLCIASTVKTKARSVTYPSQSWDGV